MAILTKDLSYTAASTDGTNTFTFIIRIIQESLDTAQNKSKVTIRAILKQAESGTCFTNKSVGVSCSVNNKQLFSSYKNRSLAGTDEHIYYTWNGVMQHAEDGSLSLDVLGRLWITDPDPNQIPSMQIDEETELVEISQYCTIGASDANIGSNTTIVLSPNLSAGSYSIRYTFGNLSGYILADGSTSETEQKITSTVISFPLPEAFYYEIPDRASAPCQLRVNAYKAGTCVTTADTTFTVTASKSLCAPVLTASVIDENTQTISLTGDENKLIRFMSDALCQARAEARHGAQITSITVNGLAMEDCLYIPGPETGTFVFTATDSRGYTTDVTVQKELVPYIRLTCTPTAHRTAPTTGQVALNITGQWYNGSFGIADNTLTGRCRAGGNWQPISIQPSQDHTYEAVALLEGLDYTCGHLIEVELQDSVDTVSAVAPVSRGVPVFDWGENYFNFHVPVHFGAGATGLT